MKVIATRNENSPKGTELTQKAIFQIQLTQAELLFLMRLLDLPDLPGVGERPWGDVDLDTAENLFKEAGLALKSRGVVDLDQNEQPFVDKTLKAMLSACAFPEQMVFMALSVEKGLLKQIYYYRVPEFDVRHVLQQDRVHSFEVFSYSDLGYEKITELFKERSWSFSSPIIYIPLQVFNEAESSASSSMPKSGDTSQAVGLEPTLAKELSETISNYDLKLMIQWIYQLNPKVKQMMVSIIAGKTSCWLTENTMQGKQMSLRLKAMDTLSIKQLLFSGFRPFEVTETAAIR